MPAQRDDSTLTRWVAQRAIQRCLSDVRITAGKRELSPRLWHLDRFRIPVLVLLELLAVTSGNNRTLYKNPQSKGSARRVSFHLMEGDWAALESTAVWFWLIKKGESNMKSKFTRIVVMAAITCLSALSLSGQGGASGSGSQPSVPSPSQSSATIENEIIAYKILGTQSGQIADRVVASCKPQNAPPTCTNVLLTDPNSQSEIITANGFEISAKALADAYDSVEPAVAGAEAAPTLSDIAALLTAIKSSAVYSNQTFQPTTQSMITLLSKELHGKGIALWTSAAPGNLDAGLANVRNVLNNIAEKRKEAYTRVQGQTDKDKKAAALAALADVDKEFSAFRTSLTATSPDGTVLATIVKGETLRVSLGKTGLLLTVSVDAAGGDTKVTHFFWRELFWPTPSPSYNGGAIVSFLLTDQGGAFVDADMFHFMYDFSKWKSPKYTNQDP
jgi:hypothetical protein